MSRVVLGSRGGSGSRLPTSIRSTTGDGIPSSACTRRPDEIGADGFSSSRLAGTNSDEASAAARLLRGGEAAATRAYS
ncbi:hypothetical protein F511_21312 [Dorcoceras hygrometricum]|uniref:Uncharacterized protein n=1 Tax=Dorcoceras hygrometricum TaxID=472368 RepID=A0A2Z7B758_9LAMI|nr:hypothetical protein F511_21312 [Dorcoceras hygrometricum]